jgi:hypothetical protein
VSLFIVFAIGLTPMRSVPWDTPIPEKLLRYWDLLEWDIMQASWEWMHSSIFGHLAMFSWYFEQAWQNPPLPKFPQQTAPGIYRAVGYTLPEALYTDIGGIATNVFTIFKPPIEDYTLTGSLVFFLACGVISGWAYRRVRLGRIWPMALLMASYTNAMNIGGWFLTYNSITGAFIIVGTYLHWIGKRKRDAEVSGAHRRIGAAVPVFSAQSAFLSRRRIT